MDETAMWESLRPRLVALDPVRVENIAHPGTPDVNYAHGVMELKYLAKWPKRAATVVRLRKLEDRPGQVAFLYRRWSCGGPAFLALRVDRQLLVFAGHSAREVRNGRTRFELENLAVWGSDAKGKGDWAVLLSWLRWDRDALPAPDRAKFCRLRSMWTVERTAFEFGMSMWQVEAGEREDCDHTNTLLDHWLS